MSIDHAIETARKIIDSGEALAATNEEIRAMAEALVALQALCIGLAAARHVPGFQVKNTRGPKPSKKAGRDLILAAEMIKRRKEGQSIRQAAKYVAGKRKDLGKEGLIDRKFRRMAKDPNAPARKLLRLLRDDE